MRLAQSERSQTEQVLFSRAILETLCVAAARDHLRCNNCETMIARLGRSALRVRPRDVAVAARTRLSSAAPAAAPQPPAREAVRDELGRAYATGRRKSSSARVWVFPGDGRVRVNGRNMVEYFKRATHVDEVIKPFLATKTACAFDVRATVAGGGLSGQAGAIRLGVARALQVYDPNHRPALKAAGLLTRDARVVERKKPGRKKARKAFQWVKR